MALVQPSPSRVDHRAQQPALLRSCPVAAGGGEHHHALLDRLGRGGAARDLDLGRILEEGLGDALDLGRHGGRVEQRLPRGGREREDALDVRDEAHVEHPVGLVHHHDLDAGEQQLATLEMVEEPPRRGDQHVHAAVDQQILLLEGHAADQQRLGELEVLGVGVEVLGHLGRELARGGEHEAARHARAGAAAGEPGDHGQDEGGGLAGPGLGDAEHVAPFERGRDGVGLDRGGDLVAGLGHGLENLRIEVQVGEMGHQRPDFHGIGPLGVMGREGSGAPAAACGPFGPGLAEHMGGCAKERNGMGGIGAASTDAVAGGPMALRSLRQPTPGRQVVPPGRVVTTPAWRPS